MTSALMECFTALLTLGLFAALLCERMLPRVRPRPEAGRLLFSLRRTRWFRRMNLLSFAIGLGLAVAFAGLATLLSLLIPDSSVGLIPLPLVVMAVFFHRLLGWSVIASFASAASLGSAIHGVEIRQNGVVSGGGRKFVPWAKVECCAWKGRGGRLCIQLRRGFLQFAIKIRVDVPSAQIASLTQFLLGKVEVRDQAGQPVPLPSDFAGPPPILDEPLAERSRFQFGLKTALLIVLVAASACSWYAIRRNRWLREEQAMASLAALQAEVFDVFGHAWSVNFSKCPRQPNDEELAALAELPWLQWLTLADAPVTDAGLGNLKGLKHLESLTLSGTNVSDAGLVHLRDLQSVQSLALSNTQITDAGLVHLERLTRVDHLDLSKTKVNGSGLIRLRGMKSLGLLWLADTQVTDACLRELSGHATLSCLSLAHTRVTDAGLVHLKGLHDLGRLDLEHTQVTDAGIASLSALPRLAAVDLKDTNVGDAVIEHLLKLPRLDHVTLAVTKVTEDGRKRLRAARPILKID